MGQCVPGPWSRSLVPGPGPGPWSQSRSLVPVPGPGPLFQKCFPFSKMVSPFRKCSPFHKCSPFSKKVPLSQLCVPFPRWFPFFKNVHIYLSKMLICFCGKRTNKSSSPHGSVCSFEGWVLLRISLGLAVRSFWSHLEKFSKSASGEILQGWVNILAWGPFRVKKWYRKNMFCGGTILWWGFEGIHPAQMNSMVPRTHMARLLCPQPPLENKIQANSPKIRTG